MGTNIRKRLGMELEHQRKLSGLTQVQVAALVGKSETTVVNWERGKRDIKLSDLVALLKVFEANPGVRTSNDRISLDEIIGVAGQDSTCGTQTSQNTETS